MEINRMLNNYVDLDNFLDPRAKMPNGQPSAFIWGKIFEYLSVKDECRFRQCAFWTNILSNNTKSPLSPEKIQLICEHASFLINKKFISTYDSQYIQNWYKRVLDLSTESLRGKLLNKDIFITFPNLRSVRFHRDDIKSIFRKNSKFFDNENIRAPLHLNRNIILKFEKSSLHLLGEIGINKLFALFPFCNKIEFNSTSNVANKISIDDCWRWGRIPEKIYNLYKTVVFERNEKNTLSDFKKLIFKEKNECRDVEKEIVKKKSFSNIFLLKYYDLTTEAKNGIFTLESNEWRDCDLKAIEKGNVLAMYNRFVEDNFIIESSIINQPAHKINNKAELKNYHLLENAVRMEFPPAQYLFGRIESSTDVQLRSPLFDKDPIEYIESAAKAGYPPACQFLSHLEEQELRKRKSVELILEESQGLNKKTKN